MLASTLRLAWKVMMIDQALPIDDNTENLEWMYKRDVVVNDHSFADGKI